MASMTIRNLDEQLKKRLRTRAASRGRSMEDEAREILRAALSAEPRPQQGNLATRIRNRMTKVGGVELELPPREPIREPVDLGQ
ncbi:FitA-like ribbon-helix-helix domain-containing protein [Neoaquamicrobium sediminum]|uniref:FitA-like ribbon-helix-helix domain-containing protein n=1 Tax=Neoaquamicrobium sediminum TaxID=1849104 RepID=UPI0015636F01|nr:plasmid stabilization protein [Mesorhizobium sediminum]NRC57320.1 plasmid stabilization protein [Mesorhizobium sediminum]